MIKVFLIALTLCFLSTPAWANAGLPMIFVTFPTMVVAFIPIVLIEAYIFKRGGIPFKRTLGWITLSNIFSTLIGAPLTWAAALAISYVSSRGLYLAGVEDIPLALQAVLTAPFLGPSGPSWQVPVAFLILLIPFFWVSYFSERAILRRGMKEQDKKTVHVLCFRAHIASYIFLALFPIINAALQPPASMRAKWDVGVANSAVTQEFKVNGMTTSGVLIGFGLRPKEGDLRFLPREKFKELQSVAREADMPVHMIFEEITSNEPIVLMDERLDKAFESGRISRFPLEQRLHPGIYRITLRTPHAVILPDWVEIYMVIHFKRRHDTLAGMAIDLHGYLINLR